MNQTNWTRELFEAALIGVFVFIAIQVAVANFRVEGSSMRPTLMPGHYLMVNKLVYYQVDTERLGKIIPFWNPGEPQLIHAIRPPHRGDVIVFNYPLEPDRQFVKRIIGEPGDLVAIADGKVTVNNRTLDEPYLDFLGHTHMHAVQLAGDEYFVLGDNRTGSRDSRHWGPLPEDHIIGRVWAIYWPRSAWGFPK
ncbi:MAG: signal peptidase I [Dehalococcoidia bacterium]|nr:signal peptidase I [Dehalococcoidia bacterium]